MANRYLDVLGRELALRGKAFMRYTDDSAMFVARERMLESLMRWQHTRLDEEVNAAKGGVGRSEQAFCWAFASTQVALSPPQKTIERLKDQVRALWDARQNLTSE